MQPGPNTRLRIGMPAREQRTKLIRIRYALYPWNVVTSSSGARPVVTWLTGADPSA